MSLRISSHNPQPYLATRRFETPGLARFGQVGIGHGSNPPNKVRMSVWQSLSQSFHLFFDNFKQFWGQNRKKPLRDQAEMLAKRLNRSLAFLWDGTVFLGSIFVAWMIAPFCKLMPSLKNNPIFNNIERAYLYRPVRYNDTQFITDKTLFDKVDDVNLTSKDGRTKLNAWYFSPQSNRPVVILAHGRNTNIQSCEPVIRKLIDKGYGVFAVDYRGFGDSKGSPKEADVYDDLDAASKYLAEKRGCPSQTHQILLGHSLGGAVAAEVATRRPFKAVVLASTFTNLHEEMQHVKHMRNGGSYLYKTILPDWLLKMTVKAQFNTQDKVKKITAPMFFVHGAKDEDVSPKFSKQLFEHAQAEQKQQHVIPNVKHDLLSDPKEAPKLADALDAFLREHRLDTV